MVQTNLKRDPLTPHLFEKKLVCMSNWLALKNTNLLLKGARKREHDNYLIGRAYLSYISLSISIYLSSSRSLLPSGSRILIITPHLNT
jgi:hypothetical protein